MLKRVSVTLIVLLSLAMGSNGVVGQQALDETLTTLEKWVETERLIAQEANEWAVEKRSIEDLIKLYTQELDELETEIKESESDVSAADAEREKLTARNERLREVEDAFKSELIAAEQALRGLHPMLPLPLREEIQPIYSQVPTDPASSDMALGTRIQFLVGILTQIQKFNGAVTLTEGFREFEAGNSVQIDSIYFGLGSAYYVDKANEHAGRGVLTESGWEWVDDPSLVPTVRTFVDIYQGKRQAEYVSLPVEIQ